MMRSAYDMGGRPPGSRLKSYRMQICRPLNPPGSARHSRSASATCKTPGYCFPKRRLHGGERVHGAADRTQSGFLPINRDIGKKMKTYLFYTVFCAQMPADPVPLARTGKNPYRKTISDPAVRQMQGHSRKTPRGALGTVRRNGLPAALFGEKNVRYP